MRFNSKALRAFVLGLAAVSLGSAAHAQPTETFRQWNQSVAPFRIAGPLYYVGVAQVTSLLVTTPQGHILIDGAFGESAAAILDNVRALGFKPEDVRVLLSTHAHIDHAGGLAELKAKTGARLYAGAADVPLLARGGKGDFAFGDDLTFPPVTVDVAVKDGDHVELGGIVVRAIATPGHTMGCTSWGFTIDDGGRALRVLMLGGTTAPNYVLVNNAKYPGIAGDFEQTFSKLRNETVDVFLEGHGFAFGLEDKRAGKRSFVDPDGYRARLAEAERAFRGSLEKQRAEAASPTALK
jgi:metallo-beta-lactamase class B